jgi:hypothetical protein
VRGLPLAAGLFYRSEFITQRQVLRVHELKTGTIILVERKKERKRNKLEKHFKVLHRGFG